MNMNYEEARAYLNQISKTGSVLGLDTIRALMEELGRPDRDLRLIHIAGTNGKGSILTYTANILKAAGYKVGTYISPAVMGYEERYQINCEWMRPDELPQIVEDVKAAAEAIVAKGHEMPTVFEFETAVAFLYFVRKNCDFAILETGLGGNLDSTNVVEFTEICAFASISYDHMAILGNTLAEIAEKKAGIIKPGSTVITGWQLPEAEQVIRDRAEELGCDIVDVDRESLIEVAEKEENAASELEQIFDYKWHKNLKIKLLGRHQLENASTAIEIADALAISEDAILEGLEASKWPGRFEIIQGIENYPVTILDGAHNPDAAKRLAEGLDILFPDKRIYAVVGMFRDKDYESVADVIAPKLTGGYSIDLPDDARSLDKETLAEIYTNRGVVFKSENSIEAAINEAVNEAVRNDGIVLVTGSLSYLGEAKSVLDRIYG